MIIVLLWVVTLSAWNVLSRDFDLPLVRRLILNAIPNSLTTRKATGMPMRNGALRP